MSGVEFRGRILFERERVHERAVDFGGSVDPVKGRRVGVREIVQRIEIVADPAGAIQPVPGPGVYFEAWVRDERDGCLFPGSYRAPVIRPSLEEAIAYCEARTARKLADWQRRANRVYTVDGSGNRWTREEAERESMRLARKTKRQVCIHRADGLHRLVGIARPKVGSVEWIPSNSKRAI